MTAVQINAMHTQLLQNIGYIADDEALMRNLTAYTEKLVILKEKSAETIENKTEGKNTTEPINAMDECEARLRAQAPKERSEEEREEHALKDIKEDFMDNWQMDLFDAGLWDGEDNSLQEIIEKIKKKYGSYRAALDVMLQTCHSPEEFESFVSCCL